MTREETAVLGPVAHIAFVVDDVAAAVGASFLAGARWSTIRHPVARLLDPAGRCTEVAVDYAATSGGEPRVKLLSTAPGSLFVPEREHAVHHLSYWVDDLERSTSALRGLGWRVEATGVDERGEPGYRYLRDAEGRRIELGLRSGIAAFDAWADGAPASDLEHGAPRDQ